MAFSASWNRKQIATNRALIGTAPDPAHGGQDPGNPGPRSWQTQFATPGTPDALLGPDTAYDGQVGGGGPVDMTPVDHTTGLGAGAGLPEGVSSQENEAWHATDYGATDARRWAAPVDTDGSNIVERLQEPDPVGELGSLATVDLHVGTNKQSYPNTRPGHRVHFWRDRVMDRRTFTTDHRPLYTPNAYTNPVAAGAGGNQYTSPYPQGGGVNTLVEKAPQLRRVPTSWGEPVTTDGTETPQYSDAPLDVWGQ